MWNCSTTWSSQNDGGAPFQCFRPFQRFIKATPAHWLLFGNKQTAFDKTLTNNTVRSSKHARLEAVLFVADSPLSAKKIADAAKLIDAEQTRSLIDELNLLYDAEQCPFRVEQIASGYQLLTRPEYSQWLDRIHHRNIELKLSPSALDTLTIVAYRQKITRADIEAIRGVQSSEVIKQLMERQLIRIGGEEDSLGRPYLYETTKFFLQYLGIRRIEQLPNYPQLREQMVEKKTVEETDSDEQTESEAA